MKPQNQLKEAEVLNNEKIAIPCEGVDFVPSCRGIYDGVGHVDEALPSFGCRTDCLSQHRVLLS